MHSTSMQRLGGAAMMLFALVAGVFAADARRPPVIKHEPVTVAVRGQPISIRATVTSEAGMPRSVTLFYTTSRDSAPFKLQMQPIGGGAYFATLSENFLAGQSEVSYYIEAVDSADAVSETRWYRARIQAAGALGARPPVPGAPAEPARETASWKTPALIAGGVAAAVGGGILLASGGGGGGGGSDVATNLVGTYAGSATTCLQMSGDLPSCSSAPIAITIDDGGAVVSDTLKPGTRLQGKLSGSDFALSAPVAESNLTGQIRYIGAVFSGRIAGNIEGAVVSTGGQSGAYSGSFGATKQ